MNTRRTTLLIAIILAVGTGWLTLTYLSALKPANNAQRAVLVATQEIPARARITAEMVSKQMRPAQGVEPDAIADPSQAVGALALITIPNGGQITSSKVGTNVAAALPVRLEPGMRAVSIPVDRVKDVAGLIQPGDRVDVIAIPPSKNSGPPPKAVTIFRAIRVLAVGNAMENPSATPSPQEEQAATVTLEVTPRQADLLAWADSNATLRLALRSPREATRTEVAETLQISGNSAQQAAPVAPAPAAPAAAAPAPPAKPTMQRLVTPVELIVGDQIVDPGTAAAHQ
ncbi:MAG TPA: Flp pilus assembly protein CpaB [Candidatus Baltobacteraceae bacterium]|nr:Flp pilus assembly protein CpaB [Candidatus Baltobacteraceae bacterium]